MQLSNFPQCIFSGIAHKSIKKLADWLYKQHCLQALPNPCIILITYLFHSCMVPQPYSPSLHYPQPLGIMLTVYEGTPTDYCKDQAAFDAGAVSSPFGLWNPGTDFQHIQPCHPRYLPSVGPSLVRNLPCSTFVTSVPIHWQFSQFCYPRLFMFSLNPQSPSRLCGYYWPPWPFLPLINR